MSELLLEGGGASSAKMVKVRMNTVGVAAEIKCLRRLIGMRCSNVYDLSPKVYSLSCILSSFSVKSIKIHSRIIV
ncbi:hypothetical protein DVH24_025319 [Malus domestica]|uniref:Uncharacterized protein n=1 Tax=Malus domestica TaxID=3750 RepID=A0A498HJW8_MALDO|nr:hypothetical protein DVH24_025319 [Malus domestica]